MSQLQNSESPTAALKLAIEFLHKNGIQADLGDSKNAALRELQSKVVARSTTVEDEEEVKPMTTEELKARFRLVASN